MWVRRRFVCGNCDSRWLEEHPEFDGRLTRRLAQRLVADAEVMTIRAVVRRHGVSWPSVNALVRAWSGLIAEHRRSRRCRVLLVDETSMRKRHRYVTVIVNADTGRTLAMVEHRSSAALSAFLMSQPHKWRRGVKVVVPRATSLCGRCLPHGHVPLTVIRWFCAGLTAVRRDIQRREPHGVKPAFDPEVFRARFLLLRTTLAGADQARPRRPPPTPAQSRLASGTPRPLHRRRQGALEALGRFCDLYETGELPGHRRLRRDPAQRASTAASRATTCKCCGAPPTDSPTQPTEAEDCCDPPTGARHMFTRRAHSLAGLPNAGRSTSTTARSPSDHNGPPQPPHGGLAARQRTCTRNGPPPSSPTLSTSTSPSPTTSSHMRVGSYSTGILQSFGGLLNADSGGSLAFNRGPSRSSLRPQTRRADKPNWALLDTLTPP